MSPGRRHSRENRSCCTCDCRPSAFPSVKCLKCSEVDQCLECFSTAAVPEGHTTSHPFMILDHISAPALREGWTTEQDSLLLIGIRNLGLWNCPASSGGTASSAKASSASPVRPPPRDSRRKISDEFHLSRRLGVSSRGGCLNGTNSMEYVSEAEESLKLKTRQINDYNEHLMEREFQTNFALEWGLQDGEVNARRARH